MRQKELAKYAIQLMQIWDESKHEHLDYENAFYAHDIEKEYYEELMHNSKLTESQIEAVLKEIGY